MRSSSCDAGERLSERAERDLDPDGLLAGVVARFHPLRDHDDFVQAVQRLAGLSDVHLLLRGKGISPENAKLSRWIEQAGRVGR